ncbi:putative TrbC/VIRB2 family protein [Brevibacillus sp. IT-7CA2]|uniref:hypothetical protein n=1 Tax=Brevibacillus sp. IT-7CA2 TaxID=3026436 RepID=UPI0039DF80F5
MNIASKRMWFVPMLILITLVMSLVLMAPIEAFAEGKLQINPDTKVLIETGESVTEKVVSAFQQLAGYACVILFIISVVVRWTAGGNQNKIQTANSFAFWGVIALAIAFTVDRLVSFFMGLFAT